MDEGKGKSAEIDEWMKGLLPEAAADVSMWQHSQCTSVDRPNTYQLPVDSNTYQCNPSHRQLVQTLPGCNSTSLMMKQESFNVPQHSGPTTFQKILDTQSGVVPEKGHPRLHMPTFQQSQNLMLAGQLNPGNHTQAMLLGPLQASSDSTTQVDMTGSIDWVNQAYHKIQQIKETYSSDLCTLYNRTQEMRLRATNVETVNKWERARISLEKVMKILSTPRSDLFRWRKEHCYQTINDVMKYINRHIPRTSLQVKQSQQVEASASHLEPPHQIQQRGNYLQPQSLSQSLRQGGPISLPQTSLNPFNVSSSITNASQYNNLMRPTQQWAPQGTAVPSPLRGSHAGFDQIALRMLLHPSTGVSQHNILCAPQQAVTSSRNVFNSLEYSPGPIAQTTPVSVSPSLNNQQDQAMKRQKMKQPVQQLLPEKNKQQTLQKRNEDTKLRRFVGLSQRGSPVLLPSSSSYTAASPQNSQQSSPQLELKDLSSKFSKSATTSVSASPSALPSPLTPLTPSSNLAADPVKSPLVEESSKFAKTDATRVHLPLQDKNQGDVPVDTQRISGSCLHRGSTSSGDKQSSHDKREPLTRLVEVVKTISSKALNTTSRDINAVTTLTDRIAGHFLHCSPAKAFLRDLADDVSNLDNEMSSLNHRTDSKLRLKRDLDSLPLDDSRIEMELYDSGRIKRLKIEPNNLLFQEIKEINKKLVEVVVDVMNVEDVCRRGSDNGTLIRCSYIPIGLSKSIKTPNTSKFMFPNLLLHLIVPADYPNASPTVSENMPSGFSDCEEGKRLWMKAKSSFGLSLRKLSQPMSVKEIAETWNVCAREVFHEFAEQMGGGNFSSTYGKWENCAVAG